MTNPDVNELARRARGGDRDAAYEILGEQAPADTWVAVINALTRDPEGVDLELVAHRTLRRPPSEVPAAVLRLARATGTSRAAFVAHTVAALRTEDRLVAEARQLRDELTTPDRTAELLAEDRAADALYAVLSCPLRDQAAGKRDKAPFRPSRHLPGMVAATFSTRLLGSWPMTIGANAWELRLVRIDVPDAEWAMWKCVSNPKKAA
jgi:hypothetical protein